MESGLYFRGAGAAACIVLATWGAGCGGSGLVSIPDLPEAGADAEQELPQSPRSPSGVPEASGASSDAGGTLPTPTPMPDAGPTDAAPVVTLSLSPTQITSGQAVTFHAIVSEPKGIANIRDGLLQDDQGGSYGSFKAGSAPSTFDLTLTWAELNHVRTIAFAAPSTSRTFLAQFTNLQGKSGSATQSLSLSCGNAHSGACGGTCVDFNGNANCGGCGKTCAAGVACRQGSCNYPRWSTCTDRGTVSATLTCAQQCQSQGKSCAAGCDGCQPGRPCEAESFASDSDCQSGTSTTSTGTCTEPLADDNGSFRCCCM